MALLKKCQECKKCLRSVLISN